MAYFQFPVQIQTLSIQSAGIEVYYPYVVGMPNHKTEEYMNQTILNLVNVLQLEQLKMQTGTKLEMTGHYEIKTNERGILSLTLSNYAYSYPMAHGFTIVKSLTFNLNTGDAYTLAELFNPGSNYVEVLSELIATQIMIRDLPLLNDFQHIQPNQDYYLADKSIVIYFQLYEIAPYYVGFPMFPISGYELQALISDSSPISILSADIA